MYVKEVVHMPQLYLSSMKLFSVLQLIVSIVRPATSLFCFTLTALISIISSSDCFQCKSVDRPTAVYLLSTKWQTDKVTIQLLNIVEHLALKETQISLSGELWRAKQR